MTAVAAKRPFSGFVTALFAALLIVFFFWSKPPYTLAFDPNAEKCLPDLHLALLHHHAVKSAAAGDLVFFKPAGALSYIGQEFVLKLIAAAPGDQVSVDVDGVKINGKVMATGLPLAGVYKKQPAAFARSFVVPQGKYFVMGTHPNSDDSRYWGLLDVGDISGTATKLF